MTQVQRPFNFYGLSTLALLGAAGAALPYYLLMMVLQFFYSFLQPFTFTGAILVFGGALSFISWKMRGEIHADSYFRLSKQFWLRHNGVTGLIAANKRYLISGGMMK